MPKELACKKCKAITYGKICSVCKSTELSPDWSGIILVFQPLNSKIAASIEYHCCTQIRAESRIVVENSYFFKNEAYTFEFST